MNLPKTYYQKRRLEHLVENRTTYTSNSAELNVYETHHFAEEVILQFNQPVFTSMLEGKKVMHLRDQSPFDYLPGQSLIMPAGEIMKIDFPEAQLDNPTKCLAMTISPDSISRIVSELNEFHPKQNGFWEYSDKNIAFTNDAAISDIIQRIIFLFAEQHQAKDFFVNMMLKELIVRILQVDQSQYLNQNSKNLRTSNRLAAAIQYIKENLDEALEIKTLSKIACMSESNFYKCFKSEMGLTPIQFINLERIKKASVLLRIKGIQIKEVYMACGFNNISYFNRTFKKLMQSTPSEFQNRFDIN